MRYSIYTLRKSRDNRKTILNKIFHKSCRTFLPFF